MYYWNFSPYDVAMLSLKSSFLRLQKLTPHVQPYHFEHLNDAALISGSPGILLHGEYTNTLQIWTNPVTAYSIPLAPLPKSTSWVLGHH